MTIDSASGARRPAIAIVGSGPSGCYAGLALAKALPDAQIVVFEGFPAPYGLVRYGIAADHHGNKLVARQFDRLFTRHGARLVANVRIGRDLAFDALASAFDIVVLATGLPEDRPLDVPREPGARVVGAGALLRALNGYPASLLPASVGPDAGPLGDDVVVLGMGNVAMDVARLLAKDVSGFHGTDIADEALKGLRPEPPSTIHLVSRSSAEDPRFDLAMLRELAALPGVGMRATGVREDQTGPVPTLLREHDASTGAPERTEIRLHFERTPERVDADATGTLVRLRPTADGAGAGTPDGPTVLRATTVVTALGFTHGVSSGHGGDPGSWSAPSLYRVGWLGFGSRGAIAANRAHAHAVADTIVQRVASGAIRCGGPGFAAVAEAIASPIVDYDGWLRIDAFERSTAGPDRSRTKVRDIAAMLAIAGGRAEQDRAGEAD